MDVEILTDDGERMEFVLRDANPAFANALRRTMIAKVPTMAVHEVDIINNTSGLFDEMLAHRIGLVPLSIDPDEYTMPEECDCDGGCSDCQVELVLKKDGEGTVKARHMKPTDQSMEIKNPETILAKLLDDQEVDLEAKAVLGIGQDHARHQAANASYRYYPVVRHNGDELENNVVATRLAPDEVKDADGPVDVDEDIKYAMDEAIDGLEVGDTVEIIEQDDAFLFSVDSVSGHEASEIVARAIDVLEDDLDGFESAIDETL